eukprot:EC721714.1.p1 GENE.EC721714.1~~EC721714.1.p1  ORF type:complete len:99 (+),score=17.53 EC721714.1:32-328(+)
MSQYPGTYGQPPASQGYQSTYQQPYPAAPAGPTVVVYEQSPSVVLIDGPVCPRCSKAMQRGGIPIWAIILCVLFFPIGLLCLLCRDPDRCYNCGYTAV